MNRVTHMKENETKYNELVLSRLKGLTGNLVLTSS